VTPEEYLTCLQARAISLKFGRARTGNWLSLRQAQALVNAPDITTVKGLRDRAILAVLFGCGLRRSEVAALTHAHSSSAMTAGASLTWWQARSRSHGADAHMGQSGDRRVGIRSRIAERVCFPTSEPSRPGVGTCLNDDAKRCPSRYWVQAVQDGAAESGADL